MLSAWPFMPGVAKIRMGTCFVESVRWLARGGWGSPGLESHGQLDLESHPPSNLAGGQWGGGGEGGQIKLPPPPLSTAFL